MERGKGRNGVGDGLEMCQLRHCAMLLFLQNRPKCNAINGRVAAETIVRGVYGSMGERDDGARCHL